MASRLLSRDFLYRFHDVRIGAAAADVAAHPFSDFGGVQIGCGIEIAAHMAGHARLDLVKHRHGRAYLTGRAIAALKCIMPDKGRLHGMKILRRPQTSDRGDAVVPVHDGQSEAGIDPPAIANHGTGTALAMIATLLGPGKLQMFAPGFTHSGTRIESEQVSSAVHPPIGMA